MEKVNCGFCGTAFWETEEKCPVCGFPRKIQNTSKSADILLDEEFDFLNEEEPVKKTKAIFDYDEVNADEEEVPEDEGDYNEDNEEDEDDEPKSNALVIVLLVILITLLLLATGFVFFRFFLPNVMGTEEPTVSVTEEVLPTQTEETTEATIPCKMLALTSGAAELSQEGQPWLLHVTVTPEDTTDQLTFASEDESVATVSEDGKIIAVGEGETIVHITCGNQSIKCPVVVDYDMIVEETLEEAVPPMSVDDTEETTESTEETMEEISETEADAETDAPSAEKTNPADIILKLKESDISLSKVRGVTYELTLDCNLTADQVEWITMNSNIVLVRDGVITVMGPGTTKIVAKYNGQSVECIVRCVF